MASGTVEVCGQYFEVENPFDGGMEGCVGCDALNSFFAYALIAWLDDSGRKVTGFRCELGAGGHMYITALVDGEESNYKSVNAPCPRLRKVGPE